MKRDDLSAALKALTSSLVEAVQARRCGQCQVEVAPSHTFCGGCGALLKFACPKCQHECLLGQAHCVACGSSLSHAALVDTISFQREKAQPIEQRNLLDLFTELQTLSDQRYVKLRGRRRDSNALRFVKLSRTASSNKLLENEASALARIQHAHVCKLVETQRNRSQILLEFEHVEVSGLRFPLDITRLCRLMLQLAEALAAVHDRGLLHGDVKPGNVLIDHDHQTGRDRLVLCDFEIAQQPGPSAFNAMTPLFSAPEQIVGDQVDFRVDVYAFGTILYLWFFYDRLPSLLEDAAASNRTMGQALGSKPYLLGTPLTEETIVGYRDADSLLMEYPRRSTPLRQEQLLGAKYHFSAELDRLTSVNRRLDLAGDILELVREATSIDPSRRPKHGQVLVERMKRILGKIEDTTVAPRPAESRETEAGETHPVTGTPSNPAPAGRPSTPERTASLAPSELVEASSQEGEMARQRILTTRLRKVPRGWWVPRRVSLDIQHQIEHAGIDATILGRKDGRLERVRRSRSSVGVSLLLNEFEALRAVEHENVISLNWARRIPPWLCVATSWRELDRGHGSPHPLPWLLERMIEAASGVAAVHRAGLVHGDLKPSTILMGQSWTWIADFKCATPPGHRRRKLFTPKFAAPEQVLEEPVDTAADIYALGMTLYSLFIKERFPMILRTSEKGAEDSETAPADDMPILSAMTHHVPLELAEARHEPDLAGNPNAVAPAGPEVMIGAKIRFQSRLKQVLEGAPDAGLVGEVLEVVQTATRIEPRERFPSCGAFEQALRHLRNSVESPNGGTAEANESCPDAR